MREFARNGLTLARQCGMWRGMEQLVQPIDNAKSIAESYGLPPGAARYVAVRLDTTGQQLTHKEIAARAGIADSRVAQLKRDPRVLEALRIESQRIFGGFLPELADLYIKKASEGNIDAMRDIGRTAGLVTPEAQTAIQVNISTQSPLDSAINSLRADIEGKASVEIIEDSAKDDI